MGKKKKKNSNKKTEEKKVEEKKTEEKVTEEKKTEEKKTEEKKTEEKKTEEKKTVEKKPEKKKSEKKKSEKKKTEEKKAATKKPAEISESERKQREKNRQKALKESRSKKSAKAKAKFQKEREKKAKQKAVKKVRKLAARREQVKKLFLRITDFSLPEKVRNNILIGAFILAVIMINIAVFATSGTRAENEETAVASEEEFLLPEEEDTTSENTVSSNEEEKEEPEDKVKSSSSFNAALSKDDNLQDVYPHEGGLYFMPVSNDEESVTGALLGTCVLKKDEYDSLKEGEVLDFANDKYMILSISKGGEYGTALSMTAFDEDEDYDRVFKEEKSYEDYFGYEKIVYGLTLGLEEEQIKQMGSPDYFGNDGYEDDDMIFFAGTSLYFPLTYTMDEDVKLFFDDECTLTVPDDTMIGDEEYDVKDYLAGKHPMYPPDLMAAKIETKGNRITRYNVMFAGLEGLE